VNKLTERVKYQNEYQYQYQYQQLNFEFDIKLQTDFHAMPNFFFIFIYRNFFDFNVDISAKRVDKPVNLHNSYNTLLFLLMIIILTDFLISLC